MSDIICQMRLKRVGNAMYEDVETQHRTRMPASGDLVEMTVNNKLVLGRVAYVTPPPAGAIAGTYYVHVDEIGS